MWLMQLQLDLSQNNNNLSLVTAFFLLRSLRTDAIAVTTPAVVMNDFLTQLYICF